MLVLVVCVAVHFAFTLEAAMRFHSTAGAIFWKPYCVFERVVGDSEHNSRRLVAQIVITFDFLLLRNLHLADICGQERPTDCLFQVITKTGMPRGAGASDSLEEIHAKYESSVELCCLVRFVHRRSGPSGNRFNRRRCDRSFGCSSAGSDCNRDEFRHGSGPHHDNQ